MQKIGLVFWAIVVFSLNQPGFAQSFKLGKENINQEKEKLLADLKTISFDPEIVDPLAHYFDSEVSGIYTSISRASMNAMEKEKAIRSLVYFIKELDRNLVQRKADLYSIPQALHAYRSILTALLQRKPILSIVRPLSPSHTQLMVEAFSQYKEYALLDDIAIYKRVSSSPEFILQYLENKPGFRFADSLLLDAAAYDPLKIVFYLNTEKMGLQDKIRSNSNVYLKQIVSFSDNKQASELLPFVMQIADNKITAEKILETRTDVTQYFQLLIDELLQSISSNTDNTIFLKPLRKGIRQKALAFYVNEINELHSAAETTRFVSVKNLRPQDLYYIITSCGDELYTSSYLGLYKRLMEFFKEQSADSLFDVVGHDNFRTFIRLAANYNMLGDFLHRMTPEKTKQILNEFIGDIEVDPSAALEKAMDIADSFTSIGDDNEVKDLIRSALQRNLSRSISSRNYLGQRLYKILSDIYSLVNQKDGVERVWTTLGDYETLKRKSMENQKAEITELVLFYGDEDGVASFNNFLRSYTDKRKWEVSKNKQWVSIRSISDSNGPLYIYANLPLDIKDELDLRAQDSLLAFLEQQSLKPAIIVHRGHSYHLDKTLNRLSPSVKLAILGSCGGYNKAISIANMNPDVQVIGSKKTGAKSINDPILDVINETLVNKKDLVWDEAWKQLRERFGKDEAALNLFNEYFPPSKNLSLFVLKLFHYNRSLQLDN